MKTTEELFQEAYDDCEAHKIEDAHIKEFIAHCESAYRMSSAEFHKWYANNNYEGNVEQKIWYMLTFNRTKE